MSLLRKICTALTATVSMLSLSAFMPAYAVETEPNIVTQTLATEDIALLGQFGITENMIEQILASPTNARHFEIYRYHDVSDGKDIEENIDYSLWRDAYYIDFIAGPSQPTSFDTSKTGNRTYRITATIKQSGYWCVEKLIFSNPTSELHLGEGAHEMDYFVLVGDVNQDNVVDISDMILLSKYVSEDPTVRLTGVQRNAADLNLDGFINDTDLTMMTQFLAGHIADFWS